MKLFRHELQTLLRRWGWIAMMWWGLVFIHLGYMSAWWWEAPHPGLSTSGWLESFHTIFSSLVTLLVSIGPVIAANSLFANISPNRSRSVEMLRPIPVRTRVAVRIAVLSIAVGLPWWIHEAIYLSAVAGAPGHFIPIGILMRILLTCALWFGAGAVGWATGSIWKSCLAGGIAMGTIIVGDVLSDWLPSLSPFTDWSFIITRQYYTTGLFAGYLAIGSLALLTARLLQNRLGFFLMAVTGCFVFLVTNNAANYGAREAVIEHVSRDIPAPIRIEEKESRSMFSVSGEDYSFPGDEDGKKIEWTLTPHWEGLQENEIPMSRGNGAVTFRESQGLPLSFSQRKVLSGFHLWSYYTKEVRFAMSYFPDFTIYGGTGNQANVSLTHEFEPESTLPKKRALDATATIESAIVHIKPPVFLPLDGYSADFGSLGRTRVTGIVFPDSGGLEIRLRFHQGNGLPGLDFSPQPRRLFGLLHREKQQFTLVGHGQSPSQINGEFSSMPLQEIHLSLSQYNMPEEANQPDYLKGAELVLFDGIFQGTVTQTLDLPDAGLWSNITQAANYSADWASPPREASGTLTNPDASPAQIREEIYRITRQPPPHDAPPIPVDESHRELVRELVLLHPPAIHWFRDFWNREDADFFLTNLQKKPVSSRYGTGSIERIAMDLGWYEKEPQQLKAILETRKNLTSITLQAADDLGIKISGEKLFRAKLASETESVDPTEYPEVWQEILRKHEKDWEKNRWKLRGARQLPYSGFRLAKMGKEEPLRAILHWYLRWEPSINWNLQGMPHHQGADLWKNIANRFSPNRSDSAEKKETRLVLARQWLDADWEYDPATMTFRIAP